MPYTLRKVPGKHLWWVVDPSGRHLSKEGLPRERAEAQRRAVYASEQRRVLEGGFNVHSEDAKKVLQELNTNTKSDIEWLEYYQKLLRASAHTLDKETPSLRNELTSYGARVLADDLFSQVTPLAKRLNIPLNPRYDTEEGRKRHELARDIIASAILVGKRDKDDKSTIVPRLRDQVVTEGLVTPRDNNIEFDRAAIYPFENAVAPPAVVPGAVYPPPAGLQVSASLPKGKKPGATAGFTTGEEYGITDEALEAMDVAEATRRSLKTPVPAPAPAPEPWMTKGPKQPPRGKPLFVDSDEEPPVSRLERTGSFDSAVSDIPDSTAGPGRATPPPPPPPPSSPPPAPAPYDVISPTSRQPVTMKPVTLPPIDYSLVAPSAAPAPAPAPAPAKQKTKAEKAAEKKAEKAKKEKEEAEAMKEQAMRAVQERKERIETIETSIGFMKMKARSAMMMVSESKPVLAKYEEDKAESNRNAADIIKRLEADYGHKKMAELILSAQATWKKEKPGQPEKTIAEAKAHIQRLRNGEEGESKAFAINDSIKESSIREARKAGDPIIDELEAQDKKARKLLANEASMEGVAMRMIQSKAEADRLIEMVREATQEVAKLKKEQDEATAALAIGVKEGKGRHLKGGGCESCGGNDRFD